jgi:hypothetical protein
MVDYPTILTRKYPGQEWVLNGDEYAGLNWISDTPKPSQEELDGLWDEVVAEIEAEKQAKIDAKASAVAKLEALGLSVDEIKEAFGLEA